MNFPKMAKATITISDTAAPCQAMRIRLRDGWSLTKAKNIGVAPGGSMITKRVTNA